MAEDNFKYTPDGQQADAAPQDAPTPQDPDIAPIAPKKEVTVSWQASEFIEHSKTFGWFIALAGGAIALSIILFVITRNILAVIVVVLSAVAIGQLARSKPATNDYSLTWHGLTINSQFRPLSDFSSFSVFHDGAIQALHFNSAKRFSNPITVYFSPDDEKQIISILEQVMPQDVYKPDSFDRMMRRVRF